MNAEPLRRERLVSTELAAMAAGVTAATIRKWASRQKLTRYGRPGRAEYDLDEVLALQETIDPTSDNDRSIDIEGYSCHAFSDG